MESINTYFVKNKIVRLTKKLQFQRNIIKLQQLPSISLDALKCLFGENCGIYSDLSSQFSPNQRKIANIIKKEQKIGFYKAGNMVMFLNKKDSMDILAGNNEIDEDVYYAIDEIIEDFQNNSDEIGDSIYQNWKFMILDQENDIMKHGGDKNSSYSKEMFLVESDWFSDFRNYTENLSEDFQQKSQDTIDEYFKTSEPPYDQLISDINDEWDQLINHITNDWEDLMFKCDDYFNEFVEERFSWWKFDGWK